ncbi:hypothetical protein PACTADRAFT_18941 [Pachysolen tannophilus NRRL Y-2460]|uniref:Uncharacterized protein n=1 Tax=Pachysolen tannophilus NRRL Y-2460 TaxID=669874 RepID=A0A1E4TP17_PACTA|nr:hypothetical protein PACTADRAFT_18941 [Pachysolen tannophilus NRRL Y-2460]
MVQSKFMSNCGSMILFALSLYSTTGSASAIPAARLREPGLPSVNNQNVYLGSKYNSNNGGYTPHITGSGSDNANSKIFRTQIVENYVDKAPAPAAAALAEALKKKREFDHSNDADYKPSSYDADFFEQNLVVPETTEYGNQENFDEDQESNNDFSHYLTTPDNVIVPLSYEGSEEAFLESEFEANENEDDEGLQTESFEDDEFSPYNSNEESEEDDDISESSVDSSELVQAEGIIDKVKNLIGNDKDKTTNKEEDEEEEENEVPTMRNSDSKASQTRGGYLRENDGNEAVSLAKEEKANKSPKIKSKVVPSTKTQKGDAAKTEFTYRESDIYLDSNCDISAANSVKVNNVFLAASMGFLGMIFAL